MVGHAPGCDDTIRAALSLHVAGRLTEAEEMYKQILAVTPGHADTLHLLGLVAHHSGNFDNAVDLIMAALERSPQALYYFNLGNVMTAHNRHAAAAECFRQAVALQPDYVDAYNNLGNALRSLNEFQEALDVFCTVIEKHPDHAQAYNNLANVLLESDEIDAAIEAYRNAITLAPDLPEPRSNLLFALNYADSTSPQAYLAEAMAYGELVARLAEPWSSWLVDESAGNQRPLRIGIVSGDLKMHPVGYFLENVVRHADPQRIELIAYVTRNMLEDELTQRIKPLFSAWHSIASVADRDAASRIRDDRIDVLVDASGHTRYNRLPLFAWKPAPVQVSWAGYFASTGVRAINYVLGDDIVLPEEEAAHFVEGAWRLPDSYLCFTPPADDIAPGPPPSADGQAVTFGYFGKLTKIIDHVIAVWSEVLRALPSARLLLKSAQLDVESVRARIAERFRAHGIGRDRLVLEGRSARAAYLATYQRVDVMLSPFPYPGGTTTAESVWMGVPVVCRRGDRFLSRIGESILGPLDLLEWVADDDASYVTKAVALATDTARLVALRAGLRDRLLASPLCDARQFARNLEDAFVAMCVRRT
ncbi:tetratricopeptide repeat protein [Paraburkholderia sp. RL17-383-BIF-A]|uniref:O-linked N-acetylglucosamine transferase, SPINDLY family protein n=1 Tax=Paraburkholderia sp. RL17-383-BIF-A TaxID=3031631 RepID=UPI0038BAA20A